MKDSDEEDLFSADDIPVSLIARYFEPQDDMDREFLAESRSLEGRLKGGHRNPAKKTLRIFTAHKGETLGGVLEEIKKDGWDGYATLGDWYRYHIKHPFPEGEIIATPGTTHLDKNFHKWIPFTSSLKRNFFQKIIGKEKKVIAKIHLRPETPLMIFPAERKFLIYRILKK